MSRASAEATPWRSASATTTRASGCPDPCSTLAASPSTSPAAKRGAGRICATSGRPTVRVPVLSKTAVVTCPSCSRALPWRKMIPWRAARLMPPMMATGVARMSGQGVATTSTASARTGSPEIA